MRVAALTGQDIFDIQELPIPILKNGEVLIRVKACAIGGTDLRVFRYGNPKIELPAVTGHEIVGVVEKTESDVSANSEGVAVGIPICWQRFDCRRRSYCCNAG